MSEQTIPFLEIFSAFVPTPQWGMVAHWQVIQAVIDPAARRLEAEVCGEQPPTEEMLRQLEDKLMALYGMRGATLRWKTTQEPPKMVEPPVEKPKVVEEKPAPPSVEAPEEDVFTKTEIGRAHV